MKDLGAFRFLSSNYNETALMKREQCQRAAALLLSFSLLFSLTFESLTLMWSILWSSGKGRCCNRPYTVLPAGVAQTLPEVTMRLCCLNFSVHKEYLGKSLEVSGSILLLVPWGELMHTYIQDLHLRKCPFWKCQFCDTWMEEMSSPWRVG